MAPHQRHQRYRIYPDQNVQIRPDSCLLAVAPLVMVEVFIGTLAQMALAVILGLDLIIHSHLLKINLSMYDEKVHVVRQLMTS